MMDLLAPFLDEWHNLRIADDDLEAAPVANRMEECNRSDNSNGASFSATSPVAVCPHANRQNQGYWFLHRIADWSISAQGQFQRTSFYLADQSAPIPPKNVGRICEALPIVFSKNLPACFSYDRCCNFPCLVCPATGQSSASPPSNIQPSQRNCSPPDGPKFMPAGFVEMAPNWVCPVQTSKKTGPN